MVGVWYVYRQAWPQGPCNYPSHCRCLSVSLRPGDLTRVEQCDSPVPACLSWGGCGLRGRPGSLLPSVPVAMALSCPVLLQSPLATQGLC